MMSRFNKSQPAIRDNLAETNTYSYSTEYELVSILLRSFVQEKDGLIQLEKIIDALCAQRKEEFVAKAALFARTDLELRSVSHFISARLTHYISGKSWAKHFYEKIILQPDDMTEIRTLLGPKIPNAVRKGFKKAFDKFDSAELSKYQTRNKNISLVDIVNTVHPEPTPRNAEGLKGLINNTLISEDPWGTLLVKAGQKAKNDEEKTELKSLAWKEIVSERKIGYDALLRNLRNIIQSAPNTISQTCEILRDGKLIKSSRILPSSFLLAYRELENIENSVDILMAIGDALEISINNISKLQNTLVVVDISGSMEAPISLRSYLRRCDIALLMGAILVRRSNSDIIFFGSDVKYQYINSAAKIIDFINNFRSVETEDQISFSSIFNTASKSYDRIFIFSDIQGWTENHDQISSLNNYKKKYQCNPHIYSVDLTGHSNTDFLENQVYAMAGFTEKIFDMIKYFESDKNKIITGILSRSL